MAKVSVFPFTAAAAEVAATRDEKIYSQVRQK